MRYPVPGGQPPFICSSPRSLVPLYKRCHVGRHRYLLVYYRRTPVRIWIRLISNHEMPSAHGVSNPYLVTHTSRTRPCSMRKRDLKKRELICRSVLSKSKGWKTGILNLLLHTSHQHTVPVAGLIHPQRTTSAPCKPRFLRIDHVDDSFNMISRAPTRASVVPDLFLSRLRCRSSTFHHQIQRHVFILGFSRVLLVKFHPTASSRWVLLT